MSLRARLIVLVLGLALAAVIGRIALGDQFEPAIIVAWLREAGGSTFAVPLFVLLFVVATTLFSPAVVMMIVAGVMWGWWPGGLYVWIAANLAAHAHFAIGRVIAGKAIREWLVKRKLTWLTRELEQGGALNTVMIRQLPLPFLLVNLAGGASPMPWPRWALGNAIGLLPNCVIYTQLAAALADGAEGAKHDVVVRIIVSSTLVIGLSLIARRLQRRVNVGPVQ